MLLTRELRMTQTVEHGLGTHAAQDHDQAVNTLLHGLVRSVHTDTQTHTRRHAQKVSTTNRSDLEGYSGVVEKRTRGAEVPMSTSVVATTRGSPEPDAARVL